MHPAIHYEPANARVADLHHQALATRWPAPPAGPAAHEPNTSKTRWPGRTAGMLARRTLTLLRARGA